MDRALVVCALSLLLTACGASTAGPVVPAPPGSASGGSTHSVSVVEIPVPETPLYIAADSSAAYFGFGSSGTGSNLYRYANGTLTQTSPAPGQNGYTGGAGVYGIYVSPQDAVYWLSAYFGNNAIPQVQVECGTATPATLCGPFVDEPTAMLVAPGNTLWVGGLTYDGGGEIRTSARQTFDSDTQGVIALINGPGNAVWGILRTESSTAPADQIVQFAVNGTTIAPARVFDLPAGSAAGGLAMGGDGNVWFTDYGRSQIGEVSSQGQIREFATPHALAAPQFGQTQIVADCDGNLWFTESESGEIARVTTAGAIDEHPVMTAAGYPAAIAAPPPNPPSCERTVWVGEARSPRIAQVTY